MLFDDFDKTKFDYVKMVFNIINTQSFVEDIAYFLRGEGFGNDRVYCRYPSEIEYGETPFEGIMVTADVFDDEIIVPEKDFLEFLVIACKKYISLNPETSTELEPLIEKANIKISKLKEE